MPKVRLLPSESRRRGLPAIGLDLATPDVVQVDPTSGLVSRGLVTVLTERRPDGKRVGILSLEIVAVSLIIDRDGALAQLATRRTPDVVARAVVLDSGPTGFRVDVVAPDAPELPYHAWLALAPIGGTGALLVAIQSAAVEWPAATEMLASLRVFARDSDLRAPSEAGGAALPLPLIKPSGS